MTKNVFWTKHETKKQQQQKQQRNKQANKVAQAYRTRDLSLCSVMLYLYTTESTDLVD